MSETCHYIHVNIKISSGNYQQKIKYVIIQKQTNLTDKVTHNFTKLLIS